MMTSHHVTGSMRLEQHVAAFLAHGRATLHTWQHRRQTRHDFRALLRSDDWLLTDLGYTRWAVAEETRRPFWQPVAPHFVAGEILHVRQ